MTALAYIRRFWLILPVTLLAGCMSASLQDAMPGARNTGTYPNINIPPVAETDQLTDEEASAKLAALKSTQSKVGGEPDAKASEAARLRRLGQSHAEETLEQIEN